MAAETDQEHDISMFASLFNDLLDKAGMTRFSQPMRVFDEGTRCEWTFSPTHRSVHFTYNEKEAKLQVRITQLNNSNTETVDLYDKKDWYKVDERLQRFMEELKDDMKFGPIVQEAPALENNFTPPDLPHCDRSNCCNPAAYRIPDMQNNLIHHLCVDCMVGDDQKCSLCGNNITNASYDLKRVCHECAEKILIKAIINRPGELKNFILDVASDLYKKISQVHTDELVDKARFSL
jgi:DNA-directed RNA polymerase subunit RPC12/RpoP